MNLGFNTDVRVGDRAYHVQTEDRGPHHGKVDTAVYVRGRVVYKQSTSYSEMQGGVEASEDVRRARVEVQHRQIIESLRAGTLKLDDYQFPKEVPAQPVEKPGITIQVLNPSSWLANGQCDLQLEIRRRDASRAAAAGAHINVHLDGVDDSPQMAAHCDSNGQVRIRFPMPVNAADGAALVIQARSNAGDGEVRFNLRTRKKTPAGTA
jgi:hypothetical protein